MSELSGRVAIVTGANTGIGAVTARELARRGAHVFLACRSEERTRPVLDAIRAETRSSDVELLPLDLGSLASVRRCAEGFLARDLSLHVLVNNAGIAGIPGRTEDGFELAFGVNHLGHFLLTALLRERLIESAPSRVVTVASQAHRRAPGIDWDAVREHTRTFTAWPEYSVSKLANVLFSRELATRLEGTGVSTYAVHPGVVASDIWRRVPAVVRPVMKLFMISNEEGAETTLWCASAPEVQQQSGLYWDRRRPREPSPVARDDGLARELWARSERWVGLG